MEYVSGKLKSDIEKPREIPDEPQKYYKDIGWKSWLHWLGIESEYLDYKLAREFSRKLGIKDQFEWIKYAKGEYKDKPPLPKNIPAGPYQYYHSYHGNKGWLDWYDWLGTETIRVGNIIYREFEDARNFARSLGLKNGNEWKKFPRGVITKGYPKISLDHL